MAAEMIEVQVWVMVNDQGEYVAHDDDEQLAAEYADRIGEIAEAGGIRRVKITVKVPLPKPLEVVGTVVEEEPAAAV